MASINHLEMAKALSQNPHIQIKKSFFGLHTSVVYTPTQSPVDVSIQDYTAEMGNKLERIINAPAGQIEAAIRKEGRIDKASISNMRLELAFSRDRKFAAAQLFNFYDLQYHPVTEPRFIEGDEAAFLAALA